MNSSENPNLEYLYMRSNGINDDDMPMICEKLAKNSTLKCFDISMNKITVKGI